MAISKGRVGAFLRILAGGAALIAVVSCGGDSEKSEDDTSTAADAGGSQDSQGDASSVTDASGSPDSQDETTTVADVQAVGEAVCTITACGGVVPSGCVDDLNEYIVAADTNGCLEIMDTWLRCLEGATTCINGVAQSTRAACGEQEELAEDCRNGRL